MWLVRFERYERYGGIQDPNSDREGMGCVRVWIGSSPSIGANKNQESHKLVSKTCCFSLQIYFPFCMKNQADIQFYVHKQGIKITGA